MVSCKASHQEEKKLWLVNLLLVPGRAQGVATTVELHVVVKLLDFASHRDVLPVVLVAIDPSIIATSRGRGS